LLHSGAQKGTGRLNGDEIELDELVGAEDENVDFRRMAASREAQLGEGVENVEAQPVVAAICQRLLRTAASGGARYARVSAIAPVRGTERKRGQWRERRSRGEGEGPPEASAYPRGVEEAGLVERGRIELLPGRYRAPRWKTTQRICTKPLGSFYFILFQSFFFILFCFLI
jgi:hypothetical protein